MTILLFLAACLAAGLTGYAVAVRLGLEDSQAWAAGRPAGLVVVALPAWWCGVAGCRHWQLVGSALLLAGAVAGAATLWQRRRSWRQVLAAEAIFVAGAALLLLLRLPHPEIRGTEKPMDLGILATLLRAESFPPPDMWLAGEVLPYYYWGALLWTVPLAASGLDLAVGYNLIVALNCGLLTALAWMLGRSLAGSHGAGALAAFFAVAAGTPDGLRQLLATGKLDQIRLWSSSRQVPDTITEFPLFTHWLGDLHPHLLSLPLACLAMVLALQVGRCRPRWGVVAMLAAVFGVTWAANPWAMPPTLVAIALLILVGDGCWHWPAGDDGWRWLSLLAVMAGGLLATLPFHLSFHPPFGGIAPVHAWTQPLQLLLYAGCLLIPVVLAALRLTESWFSGHSLRRRALALTLAALILAAAMASDRRQLLLLSVVCGLAALTFFLDRSEPGAKQLTAVLGGQAAALLALAWVGRNDPTTAHTTLLLLLPVLLVLVMATVSADQDPSRPALALAGLGVFLLLVPEVLFVVDTYGDQLHRMNTVFKSYLQGWIFLAVALPVLLARATSGRRPRWLLGGAMLLLALPHLVRVLIPLAEVSLPCDLDGLAWMPAGDRALVRRLRLQPADISMIEAVGDAYTDHGRLSAASGVPALLGWANHQALWRGGAVMPELERRQNLVRELYTAGDVTSVRRLMQESGARLVAIGSLERAAYPEDGLAAIAAAGQVVLEAHGAVLVRFPKPAEAE